MKILIKYLIRTALVTILVILVYSIFALILSIVGTNPKKQTCETKNEIYVATNGVHLDIILPVSLIEKGFLKKLQVPNETNFVSFGWGDKNFYLYTPTWDDLKASTAISAMFLCSETAMHVGLYTSKYTSWREIEVCPSQTEVLLRFIKNSFKQTDSLGLTELKTTLYGENHKFFEAHGSYSFFRTCNNWVNEGLKKAEVKTSIWSPFDFGVLYHIEEEKSG